MKVNHKLGNINSTADHQPVGVHMKSTHTTSILRRHVEKREIKESIETKAEHSEIPQCLDHLSASNSHKLQPTNTQQTT